jgi:hypothetical protein
MARSRNRRGPLRLIASLAVGCVALSIVASCASIQRDPEWWARRRDSSGQAPDPATTPEAVIQVYAARAVGWKGALGVHTWIALKASGAPGYTRYEVMGWGVRRGMPAIRQNRAVADGYWFGARPDLLVDLRGDFVDALIDKVEAAVASYPYPDTYVTWPGPNSNTFIAHIGREVPELRLDLPPTAVGKDYLPNGLPLAVTPSGTGVQLSLFGLAGLLVGWEEGLEVNVLGLTFGVDLNRPALKLPGVGRVGAP